MIVLKSDGQIVKIDVGELVGYKVDGHEFMHQKGSPGWRSSDTEMFPIIGPTAEADFKVKTPYGNAIQDQHGLLRELEYVVVHQSDRMVVFEKEYRASTMVKNSKYPEKSGVEDLSWPYSFRFLKTVQLNEKGLKITFNISGERGMPFMLGYHPAFKLYLESTLIEAFNRSISIPEIMKSGSKALQVSDCEVITLKDINNLTIRTEGFGNFMLWTEVTNMLCIEPITFYPYAVEQQNLDQGFMVLNKNGAEFVVELLPF
jgi:aldose 1-epimerase